MERKYFGTDGIRGLVGQYPITPDFTLQLGYAAGKVLVSRARASGVDAAVIIGKDTRISGYMFESALEAGLAAAGVDTYLAGPMTTPAIAYLTRALRLSAGVVISASHNPFHDNGIKFFDADGKKLQDGIEAEIEAMIQKPMECVPSDQLGKAKRLDDARGRYIEFCKSTFPNELDLNGLKIVVDCANGAAYQIAPNVLHELGAEVISIGVHPDGLNINDRVGVMHPETLCDAVVEYQADLGIALDGDGDRVFMVDNTGKLYDGDEMLYIIATNPNASKKTEGVVGTLMTNYALERALLDRGIAFERAKVGDRYVLERLYEKGWTLGGETSGHIICLDAHITGDGIISALRVLSIMAATKKTLAQLSEGLTLYPQKLINVPLKAGFDWATNAEIKQSIEKVEKRLAGGKGRVLLRPSGTEPLLRVMVEGQDKDETILCAESIAMAVKDAMAS